MCPTADCYRPTMDASRPGEEMTKSALLARLFREHGGRVRRLFMRRGHSADAAADLQQEVFLRLWACDLALLSARPGQMVFRVARFVSIDTHRRLALERRLGLAAGPEVSVLQLPDLTPSQEQRVKWRESINEALEAFEQLPPRSGEALWLARIGELSHHEIAARRGVSPRTVENQIATASARFRAILAD